MVILFKTNVSVAAEPSLLQCFSERTKDSISIIVDNPRKLPFSYFIYKKNSEKKEDILIR